MEMTWWSLLVLGFVLGLRHALDADHVVAVSTIVVEERRPWRAALVGAVWGLGHAATMLVAGAVVLILGLRIPTAVEQLLEGLVGLMLIGLGLVTVWRFRRRRVHLHAHSHGDYTHTHFHSHATGSSHAHSHDFYARRGLRSLLVGAMHGLAGSAAVTLLVLATVSRPLVGVVFIGLVGFGSLVGMVLISLALSLPLVLTAARWETAARGLALAAGVASVVVGLLLVIENGAAML